MPAVEESRSSGKAMVHPGEVTVSGTYHREMAQTPHLSGFAALHVFHVLFPHSDAVLFSNCC